MKELTICDMHDTFSSANIYIYANLYTGVYSMIYLLNAFNRKCAFMFDFVELLWNGICTEIWTSQSYAYYILEAKLNWTLFRIIEFIHRSSYIYTLDDKYILTTKRTISINVLKGFSASNFRVYLLLLFCIIINVYNN